MKEFITPTYTFTPGASGVGTVNLSGISDFNVKRLVAIINQTRGVVIYSTASTSAGYSNVSGTTVTLKVDTSTHSSGDVLQVVYENTSGTVTISAALPAGTNAIGKLAANSGVDIGDVDVLSLPSIPAGSNNIGKVVPESANRTPTTTSITSSASSVTVLASNSNRRGISVSNQSTAKLYLSFTTPATIANSFIEMPAGSFLLLDHNLIVTNAIYGLWASANGTAQVTEYV
jgi:hypothetical protein